TGPQHYGPRKCYTPRCTSTTSHQSPHEAATAPPRRRRGKRRLDERSAQARGARGEAVQAGERRRLGHRAGSPQVASRSNLDSLKSGQRLGIVWGLQQPNCQSPELSAEHPDGYICSSGYPIPHAHRLFLHLLELR
ncbi:hypothetical protein PVAP13_9NG776054, partial [Panicum virgatum]